MKIAVGEFNLNITRLVDKETLQEDIQVNMFGEGNINIYTQIGVVERVLAHLKEQERKNIKAHDVD